MISGAPNPEEISNSVKRTNENHLANRLRYSLRVGVLWFTTPTQNLWVGCWHSILQVYASVLYLQLPDYFRIILRGQEVKRHSIVADLMYPECITYKPQGCGIKEVRLGLSFLLHQIICWPYEYRISYPCSCFSFLHSLWLIQAGVLTTIGFLNGSPTISVHGFNIYHKNRLILVSFLIPCIESLHKNKIYTAIFF
jgi:hypothetical protein